MGLGLGLGLNPKTLDRVTVCASARELCCLSLFSPSVHGMHSQSREELWEVTHSGVMPSSLCLCIRSAGPHIHDCIKVTGQMHTYWMLFIHVGQSDALCSSHLSLPVQVSTDEQHNI